MERKRGDRVSMVGTLAVLMTLPLWPLAAQVIGLRSACVDITELQFRPSSEPAADDPLALMQPGIQRGEESICTDVDGYHKTALEEEWNRITVLKVKLRNAAGMVLTANLSQERSAYDFYATAIHEARVAAWRRFLRETGLFEALILSLTALAWCAQRWQDYRQQK